MLILNFIKSNGNIDMDHLIDFISLFLMGTASFYRFFFYTNLKRHESGLDEYTLKDFGIYIHANNNYARQFYWVPVFSKPKNKRNVLLKGYVNFLTLMLYCLILYLITINVL